MGRARSIAFWATTILGPTSFVIGGVMGLMGGEQVAAGVQHLGYPIYFAPLLGFWKLAGAVVITVPGLPRLKEWAYAVSHAAVGDSAADIVGPLVFLALVLASYALRPASRRLASPAADAEAAGSPAGDFAVASR